jgi:hypothetical protein
MSAELKHLIRQLIADPLKLDRLEPDTERALVAALWAALGSGESPVHDGAQAVAVRSPAWSSEDLLTIDEAAAVLKVSPRSLYRHAKILPFAWHHPLACLTEDLNT